MLKTSAIAYWTFISELLLAGSIVACSKSKNSPAPAAGQAPAAVVVRETVDTIAPAPVVILLPQPQPYASSESLFEVSGTCEPAALVMVSADTPLAIEETRCTDYSTFALPVSQNNDGTYTYSFRQKDAAGNLSEPVTFVWTRQTSQSSGTGSGSNTASVPPAVIDPPVVAVPASNSFSSNLPAFSLSGTCTTGLTVRLTRPSGGGNLDSTCVGSAFIFPAVSESLAGSYTYSLVQVDSSGQQSAAVQRTWIRDLTAPSVPVRTLPATSPFTSSGSLGISGACESGATVHLAGASTQSIACVSSAFAFSVSSLPAGFYLFTLSQTDAAGNSSMPSAPFQWVRDTTSPATPTIISPSSSPYTSSGNLTISGFCELNATVNLAGSSSQSTPCSGGSFSFTVNSLPAGNHSFTVSQTDVAGNLSTPSLPLQWNRDVTAPSVPTITSPSSNPYESGGVLIISGACETGASVHLAGSASQSVMCLAGGYNFTVSSLSDGHHSFSVSQTDTAGNVSASSSVFQWVRDTAAPVTPTIISPSANPHSSGGNLVISGSCESGATVNLAGSSAQSASCSSGAFSFSVSGLSDGSYNFTLSQTDAAGNSSMPSAPLVWIRDATSPAAPTIISPSSNPYTSGGNLTISGGCETGATVYLAGSATQSAMCLSSAYTFNINSLANGTHNFTVSQTDSTGNTSPAASNPVLQWTRNSTVPPTPTISTPASSPYFSSGFLIISGVCEAGANVFLSGASVQSTPCSSLSYSFTVSGLSEGTHNFSLSQTSSAGISSASPALLQWTLDTTQPATPTIISPSSNPYASSGNLTISGGCETGATVSLAGASSQSALCSSSIYSFGVSSQPYATHNFSITQTDAAGNSSSAAALQWTRSPSAPTLSSPAGFASGGTYSSNTPSLVLAGSCESGLTVTLSGAVAASDVTVPEGSLTQTCSSSNFSFTISKSVDATYAINVRQGSSADTTLNWIRNTFVAPPAITVPATDPFSGNTTFFSLSGTCINGHTVRISSSSGSAPQVTSCSTSAFNFAVVSESSDGSYTYSVVQIDSAGNQSGAVQRTWLRDTLAPAVPTITSPSTSPHTSSGNLTISGGCETNATVNLSGSASQSTTCTASVYSFSFSASVDATYNFLISQTDEVGNASSAASLQWIRTTPSDPAPSITLPAGYSSGGSYTSNSANLVLQGGCQTGLTVTLSGDVVAADVTSPSASLTQTCASSQFSFTIAKTVDGTYAINVRQGTSSNTTLNWTKNTFVAPPTITSPAAEPYYSSSSSFTLSGTCITGHTVQLSSSASSGQSNTGCASSGYSFSLTNSVDGTYTYSVLQVDGSGNHSTSVLRRLILDTSAPLTPVVSAPSSNPITSSDSSLTISGSCESQATVYVSGDHTANTTCTNSGFSFSVSGSTNATRTYTIYQRDLAANNSGSVVVTWIRDDTIPSTPAITNPSSNPAYSSGNTVALSGTCTSGNNVYVDDGVSNTLSAGFACSGSNTFSYTSAATSADGTYKFTLYQENTSTGIVSASTVFTWVRDTSAPSAPTVTTPSVSPYTSGGNLSLSGGCENNATVNLSGASTQSTVCSNNSYAFLVIQSVDSTYNFALSQTDRAGNVSTSISRQWIRSTAVDPAPTITSPSVSPYSSKDRTLILAGGCITGRTVTLGGAGVTASDVVNPAGSLAQACVSSAYSFTISKSTDGTFALALVQGNSNSAGLNWTVDSVAPNTTLTSTPAATNLQSDSVFTFSSDDATATFQCSLDSAPFSTCLSGVKYALTNGTHSLSVRAVDALGNFDPSPASYTWTQSAYKTIALYHFNTGVPFADSGTPSWNNLTNNSTTDYVSGKFGYAREFASVTGSSPPRNLSAPHSQSLGLLRSTFSAEAWVKLSSLPGSNDAVVISKMGAGGQFGWELGFYKSGSKYYVYADLSGNGTSNSTAKSVLSATEVSGLTSGWNHVALTFDSGAVRIFFNGVQKVSSTLRFATVFDNSSTPFVIGAANGQNGLLGWIDEVRLSQIVRWTANFNPSAMFEYSPD